MAQKLFLVEVANPFRGWKDNGRATTWYSAPGNCDEIWFHEGSHVQIKTNGKPDMIVGLGQVVCGNVGDVDPSDMNPLVLAKKVAPKEIYTLAEAKEAAASEEKAAKKPKK